VTDWRAWSQRAGGIFAIRLKHGPGPEARRKLDQIMKELSSDPVFGILEVLDRAQAIERGGFPLADYVLVSRKGYEIRDDAEGDYCTETLHQKAQHGYCERFEEMRASFMIEGCGIERKCDIGSMNLIDIAPTLASVMGFDMPQAEGRNRLK